MRIGNGYDLHRLVHGRKLVLGGVEIPHSMGLAGHSDADVLTHAVCDALFGAAGLGDIGEHFPDHLPEFKDIRSILLLEKTVDAVREAGFDIVNIDTVVLAESPKLAPFKKKMAETVAAACGIPVQRVSIKATTTEGLGEIGRKNAIAALCTVLLVSSTRRQEGK